MDPNLLHIAIVGAGLFVKSQYIPRLAEIKHIVYLKAIWSRTEVPFIWIILIISFVCILNDIVFETNIKQKSAREAVEIARKEFPNVECKWGDEGLDDIIPNVDIIAVAVVLAGQIQVCFCFIFYGFMFLVCMAKKLFFGQNTKSATLSGHDKTLHHTVYFMHSIW